MNKKNAPTALEALEPLPEPVEDVPEPVSVLPFKMASSGPMRVDDNGEEELSQLLRLADEQTKSKSAILSA